MDNTVMYMYLGLSLQAKNDARFKTKAEHAPTGTR